ncbi:MAG: hypothetical protein RIB54_01025 [Fulvivirga sp.]|uniref:hypothetical protein n=1 Tax=Fulvivirga sp. TaxID=1931237 RepID=UPI0032EB5B5F
MKNPIICLLIIILFSCEAPPLQNEAKVNNIRGLYVFILSEPQVGYEVIGQVKNDIGKQLNESTSGKTQAGKIIGGVLGTAAKNISFQQLMNNMIDLAKEQYPNAEGIIFDNNLSNARVIIFR